MSAKSFDKYRKSVQHGLYASPEFRDMLVLALKIGMDGASLAKVAASLIILGYQKGETELETTEGIINGLNGALQLYAQITTEEDTIH